MNSQKNHRLPPETLVFTHSHTKNLKDIHAKLTQKDINHLGIEELIELSIHHWLHMSKSKIYKGMPPTLKGTNSSLCFEQARVLDKKDKNAKKLRRYLVKHPVLENQFSCHYATPEDYEKIGYIEYLLGWIYPKGSELAKEAWYRADTYSHNIAFAWMDTGNNYGHRSHFYCEMQTHCRSMNIAFNTDYMNHVYKNHVLKLQYLAVTKSWKLLERLQKCRDESEGINESYWAVIEYMTVSKWKKRNLKDRSLIDSSIIIRNGDGTIQIVGFNDHEWTLSKRIYKEEAPRECKHYFFTKAQEKKLSPYFDEKEEGDLSLGSTGIHEKHIHWFMHDKGGHGSSYIPFYLYASKAQSKQLYKHIQKHTKAFEKWWRSLHMPHSAINKGTGQDNSDLINMEGHLHQKLQSLFKLLPEHLDELGHVIHSHKRSRAGFSDVGLLALGQCAYRITNEACKGTGKNFLIYAPEFYFNQIRNPEKLSDEEQFYYCRFFYNNALENTSSPQNLEACIALSVMIPFLQRDPKKNSHNVRKEMQEMTNVLAKQFFSPTMNTPIKVTRQLNKRPIVNDEKFLTGLEGQCCQALRQHHKQKKSLVQKANKNVVKQDDRLWIVRQLSRLKQWCVEALLYIGVLNWRFILPTKTVSMSANCQSALKRLPASISSKMNASYTTTLDHKKHTITPVCLHPMPPYECTTTGGASSNDPLVTNKGPG